MEEASLPHLARGAEMLSLLRRLRGAATKTSSEALTCPAATFAELAASPSAARSLPCPGPVYIALRRGGRRLHEEWCEKPHVEDCISHIFSMAGNEQAAPDTIELVLAHGLKIIAPGKLGTYFANAHRGRYGIELIFGRERVRYGPTQMIARNCDFRTIFMEFLANRQLDELAFFARGGRIRRFEARQILIRLGPPAQAVELYRGNRVIAPDEIDAATIDDMISTMGGWMLRHVDDSGKMAYKYWPSRGADSTANNTIRQFMASLCLVHFAKAQNDGNALELARRNIDYNLKTFMRIEDGAGIIEYGGSAKLGAAALAGLSILALPEFDEDLNQALALLKTGIDRLWQDSGAFRTFHKPATRNDNQNFYPGEALLFWAELMHRQPDADLLDRMMKSISYYQAWHQERRNPAFVPWHSQAIVRLYELTQHETLPPMVFAMNDWLLSMQQWGDASCPDFMGRFYDPRRPSFGPPHASSTGAYLEGLVAACRLADSIGDGERAEAYGRAIWRGIRSLRQLQFLDDVDTFYISRKHRVLGGLRTETYHNEIRVDNVQHGLNALLSLGSDPQNNRSSGFWNPELDWR